jgi:hypothetical protein
MSDVLSKIRIFGLKNLERIRDNNYFRITPPSFRYDPEMIDREIRRKKAKLKEKESE